MKRAVSRETVAGSRASGSRGGNISKDQGSRKGRKYSLRELLIARRLHKAKQNGLRISFADIAAHLGRPEKGLKSKLSRLQQLGEYRRTGVGQPGRRRRADRVLPEGGGR